MNTTQPNILIIPGRRTKNLRITWAAWKNIITACEALALNPYSWLRYMDRRYGLSFDDTGFFILDTGKTEQ